MNLTGKELVQEGIITGPIVEDNIQQHGIDLNVKLIQQVLGIGMIGKKSTTLSRRLTINPIHVDTEGTMAWSLAAGWYEVFFEQGCQIPSDQRMRLVHRSSLYRCGGIIQSSLFDAGFKTDNIGTHMYLNLPIMIEVGARIAQAICSVSHEVTNLYNGQWVGYDANKLPAK